MYRTVLTVLLLGLLICPAAAEKRVVLVIGNGAYQNAPRLPNPANDASDVAAAFKRSGFQVISGSDMDKMAMDNAEIEFARIARSADVAVFYYSGHAIQFNGVNYLAPVDVKLTDEADLHRMVRLDDIVSDIAQAKALRILVLDACRDNPLADNLRRSLGNSRAIPLQRGLARLDNAQGMIVAYATQAGHTADDGSGPNSPYTSSFLKHIEEKIEIGTVFRRISADVYEATQKKQLPELSLSLIGEYYLQGKGDNASTAVPPTTDPCAEAADHWKSTEAIGNKAAYEDHLAKFGNCAFAALAKARLARLQEAAEAPTPEQSPTVTPTAPIVSTFEKPSVSTKPTEKSSVSTRPTIAARAKPVNPPTRIEPSQKADRSSCFTFNGHQVCD